jgi:hypothetical protein
MNIFKKLRASLRLREAIRQADNAHREEGGRYYVMPMGGNRGQLIIMDRSNFRKLKHKNYISRKASVSDLERECFYCTPYRNGTGELPPSVIEMKRKSYFSWIDFPKKNNGKK